MEKDDHFVEINDNESQFLNHRKRQKKGVIKSTRNRVKGTIHLDPREEASGEGVEFFQPIYEGDMIVGVIHKCSCGKSSELRFQYSDQ